MPETAHNAEGPEPLLLNAIEAAKRLGISRKTLWNNTAPRGSKIPAVRVGERLIRYRPADLKRWVDEQQPQG